MVEQRLKSYASEPVMESFFDMRNAQEPKDRLHYFDVVLEGSVETNAILLQKLYTDIISRSNVDFGAIPDSQGALTRYKEYKLMSQSMEQLNQLYEGTPSEELTLMNKIHDMIIACRKDYELGYKFDIEIIKIAYCTAVMTLFEMINICILAYTKKLRDNKGIVFTFNKMKKKDVLVIRGANSLAKAYESGQWSALINEIKKNPLGFSAGVANEAGIFTDDFKGKVAKALDPVVAFKGAVGPMGPTLKFDAKSTFKNIPLPLKIIGMAVIVFMAIRTLVFVFYNSSAKIKDWCKNQKEFIEADIRSEINDGKASDNVIEKHQKLARKLESVANFIELRILKTDAAAKKDMLESNRDNYNKSDFTNPVGFGGAIEF